MAASAKSLADSFSGSHMSPRTAFLGLLPLCYFRLMDGYYQDITIFLLKYLGASIFSRLNEVLTRLMGLFFVVKATNGLKTAFCLFGTHHHQWTIIQLVMKKQKAMKLSKSGKSVKFPVTCQWAWRISDFLENTFKSLAV